MSEPQLQSWICAGLPSESQKSLADADGAVHKNPTANAAAENNTLVFMP